VAVFSEKPRASVWGFLLPGGGIDQASVTRLPNFQTAFLLRPFGLELCFALARSELFDDRGFILV
jgi:hypothetical protein